MKIEKALLAAIFIKNETLILFLTAGLKPEDFQNEKSQVIFRAMLILWATKNPIDLITLKEELIRQDNYVPAMEEFIIKEFFYPLIA